MNTEKYISKLSRKRKVLVHELKNDTTKVIRIPVEYYDEFMRIGGGDWKKGMVRALIAYNCSLENDNVGMDVLMRDCERLMEHLRVFFPENHYAHFSNFPAFLRFFLQTGKIKIDILQTKKEGGR